MKKKKKYIKPLTEIIKVKDNLIIGNGILEQIKNFSYNYPNTITKESVFNCWMDIFKEFYEEYPYAVKLDYEGLIREILNYYD